METEKVGKTHQELSDALYQVVETLKNSQIPALVVGQTAKDMVDGKPLSGNRVEIGIFARHLTGDTRPIFHTFFPNMKLEEGLMGEYNGVPIYLSIVKGKVFENPDMVYNGPDEYKIPNPFEKYWQGIYD